MNLPEIHEFLGCRTPDAWVQAALADQETLLIDHKNCEFKAASTPEIIELTAEQRKGFREAAKSVLEDHKADIDMAMYERIMKFQEAYPEEAPNS